MADEEADVDVLAAARAQISEALGVYADGWASTAGGIVTKWVAVAEVANADGKMMILTYTDDLPTWDANGLLLAGMHQLR